MRSVNNNCHNRRIEEGRVEFETFCNKDRIQKRQSGYHLQRTRLEIREDALAIRDLKHALTSRKEKEKERITAVGAPILHKTIASQLPIAMHLLTQPPS